MDVKTQTVIAALLGCVTLASVVLVILIVLLKIKKLK